MRRMDMRRTIIAAAAGLFIGAVVMLALPGTPEERLRATPEPPRLDPVSARTLLAWTPGELPTRFAAAARTLPGVASVVEVRSGTAWLQSSTAKDGASVPAPEGFRIPVEVAAVDPHVYIDFVPPDRRASVGRLADGGVILGTSSAAVRRLVPGGRLRFDSVGKDLVVVDVLPDELIGAHEALVSTQTGTDLRITRARYTLVALADDGSLRAVERELHRIAPRDVPLRLRAPGETPAFRHGDAVLPPVRLKELFGEFAAEPAGGNLRVDPRWTKANIVTERIPVLGSVECHVRILPQLRAAFEEVARRGLDDLVDASDFGGCFFPRFLNQDPGAGLSHHSLGVAFDINVSANPFGAEPRMDRRLVEILERWGFTWGGRWLVPDSMHFEFLRFPLSPKG